MKTQAILRRPTNGWICNGCKQQQLVQLRVLRRSQDVRHHSSLSAQDVSGGIQRRLPDSPARTRFAPSPTGFMHLGSLRTALFNYLLARATNGQFVLRIEDTDTRRTVPGALERIKDDLNWAGIHWDEGPGAGGAYGPYIQSQRTELYRKHAQILLDKGHAYRCFCSAERLRQLAEQRAALGLPIDYDRTCAGIEKSESDDRAHKGEQHTVRLASPEIYPMYVDLVYGRVGGKSVVRSGKAQKRGEVVYEDPILLKSDGMPTYHLANVVDDHLMEITHVIRGTEWMPSTPKHLAMYEAFGWKPPSFAHVGLLQDASGQKLSKRNADIDVASYRRQGYLPDALANFCVLLGWSHKRGNDAMDMQDMVDSFNLKFTKGNTVVSYKKLHFLQSQHVRRHIEQGGATFNKIIDDVLALFDEQGSPSNQQWAIPKGPISEQARRDYVGAILRARPDKYTLVSDFINDNRGFFVRQYERSSERIPVLETDSMKVLLERLDEVSTADWQNDTLKEVIDDLGKALAHERDENSDDGRKKASNDINKFLRWAILSSHGPPMSNSMEILGRDVSLERLKAAINACEKPL